MRMFNRGNRGALEKQRGKERWKEGEIECESAAWSGGRRVRENKIKETGREGGREGGRAMERKEKREERRETWYGEKL